jgi:hypothetical protein
MKKTELILGIIISLSVIMNLLMIPFAGPLNVVSIGALAMIYVPLGYFIFNNTKLSDLSDQEVSKGISTMKAIGTIGLGVALSITLIGILFKLMRWPGANTNLAAGLFLQGIILIIAYLRYSQNKSSDYIIIFKRIAIIGGTGLILFLLPHYAIMEFKYRNHPSYIEAVKKSDAHPENKELREEVLREYMKMYR